MSVLQVGIFIIPRWPIYPSWYAVFFVLVTVGISIVSVVRQNVMKRKADREKREWNLRLCELSDKESALRREAAAKRTAGDPSWAALLREADRLHKEQDRMLFPNVR